VDVSIQLKNPLSIVQGYLENLLDGMISEPVLLRQSLLTMRKHTLQIERVIDGLRR
jgi:signal transduction histidine kinase